MAGFFPTAVPQKYAVCSKSTGMKTPYWNYPCQVFFSTVHFQHKGWADFNVLHNQTH